MAKTMIEIALDIRAEKLAKRVQEDKRLFGYILHSTETAIDVLTGDYAKIEQERAGRVVKAVCVIGVTVSAACFLAAAFLPLPAHSQEAGNTPSAMAIYGVDSNGGEWIIGSGDTCESAAENMKVPPVALMDIECAPYQLETPAK